jgi:hypothetical protein
MDEEAYKPHQPHFTSPLVAALEDCIDELLGYHEGVLSHAHNTCRSSFLRSACVSLLRIS